MIKLTSKVYEGRRQNLCIPNIREYRAFYLVLSVTIHVDSDKVVSFSGYGTD